VQVLYFLESIRIPVLNELMLLITKLGEETAFLTIALIIFWCVNKKQGYYIMAVGFLSTMVNHFLKLTCRVPRPWVLNPEFSILEQAREAATGYSFPSGHSQTAVATFGALALSGKARWLKALCVAVCILVPLSRMYVGVHTPADVLAGSGLALIFVFLLKKPVLDRGDKTMPGIIAVMLLVAAALYAYVSFWKFPEVLDAENLHSAVKNAYTMLGSIAGIALVYPLEKKYVRFSESAVWYVQLIKIIGGLLVVLAVKEGLRTPLEAAFAGHMAARAVRYFAIVLTAGLLWPMSFRHLEKIGVQRNELRNH